MTKISSSLFFNTLWIMLGRSIIIVNLPFSKRWSLEVPNYNTILYYNERLSYRLYWSKEGYVAWPLIPKLMPIKRFELIKRYLHVCHNSNLDLIDKWTKLWPFIELINRKLKILGIYRSHLLIDEQIIPYYGHHNCKMHHREKKIWLGFQFWVLAGDYGCPLHFEP